MHVGVVRCGTTRHNCIATVCVELLLCAWSKRLWFDDCSIACPMCSPALCAAEAFHAMRMLPRQLAVLRECEEETRQVSKDAETL